MRKVPTLFCRDFGNVKGGFPVIDKINPSCQWVDDGEGVATQKLDGTAVLIKDGLAFKRREINNGAQAPEGFVIVDVDSVTNKITGWVPVGEGAEDRWIREGVANLASISRSYGMPDGTYELVGPKVQGNAENRTWHELVRHGSIVLHDVPRDFQELKHWLSNMAIEGVVWHHPDGRMAKIKQRDFGLKRQPRYELKA